MNGAWAAAAMCDICSMKYMSSGWREISNCRSGAERCAAEGAELFLIDLLEQGALVKVDGRLEVLDQLAFRR
jgi:hypothetical protein